MENSLKRNTSCLEIEMVSLNNKKIVLLHVALSRSDSISNGIVMVLVT